MPSRLIRRVPRSLLTAATISLLASAAVACGSSDDAATPEVPTDVSTDAPTTESAPTPESSATTDATDVPSVTEAASGDTTELAAPTRTVVHELGTSEVPVDPQRIVVVDRRGSLAFLLELGFEPVGALDATWLFGEPFHPLIADFAEDAGVEPIDDTDGPNLEQIAALQPDLIIGNVRDMGETTDELAQLAPTVGLSWDFADPLANAVTIGEALGRPEEAQALVDEFDESMAAATAETADPGTVSIIGLFAADDIRIYREHNLYGRLTEQLGGQIVPDEGELPLDPEDNEVNYVSMEQISLASGERVISFVNLAAEEAGAYEELVSAPLVQALPAFQSGQVLEADPQLAFGAAGSTGINVMLDELVAFYNS
jgi:iron complex transport system substrate-binding protein